VEKNHAWGRVSPLSIVHADPVALDELSQWWISSFRYDREHKVPDDQKDQENKKNGENGCDCGHIPGLDSAGLSQHHGRHLLHVEEPNHQLTGFGAACSWVSNIRSFRLRNVFTCTAGYQPHPAPCRGRHCGLSY
jgi:hypothetical protein